MSLARVVVSSSWLVRQVRHGSSLLFLPHISIFESRHSCPPSSCCHFYIHSHIHHLDHSYRLPEISCWSCSFSQLGDLQVRICGIWDWICLWGPEVKTGGRRHLLKCCQLGRLALMGLSPPFIFQLIFLKLHRASQKSTTNHRILALECL